MADADRTAPAATRNLPTGTVSAFEKYSIGREPTNDIFIDDASVSRQHCYLVVVGDRYRLIDLGSTNGTWRQSWGSWVPIAEKELRLDDPIRLGRHDTTISSLILKLGEARERRPGGTRIFISYRRNDTSHLAGRIFDKLSTVYKSDDVFFDLNAIPAGLDFKAIIRAAMAKSAVVLALIGRNWRPQRGAEIAPSIIPEDHVQQELESAIAYRVPVLPILCDGAPMPVRRDLPATIADLADINAEAIRSASSFHDDMSRIIIFIDRWRSKSTLVMLEDD